MLRTRLTAGILGTTAAALSALALTSAAGAAPATHSGTISYHSVSEGNAAPLDVVTGAIVDHGSDHSMGQAVQKVVLSKGTFEVASAKLNKGFKFTKDTQACTAEGVGSASNLAISHGTGAYAGITGSITVKAIFIDIGVVKNGVCENLNTHSAASLSSFSGVGHVSY